MYYVYIIKSLSHPHQTYIGYTADIENRLQMHNAGKSPHTARYMPWEIDMFFAFRTKEWL